MFLMFLIILISVLQTTIRRLSGAVLRLELVSFHEGRRGDLVQGHEGERSDVPRTRLMGRSC